MSVDTITRINDYFKSAVADVLPVYTRYKNQNKNLPETSGAMVDLWVEPDSDDLYTDALEYQEDGVVIAIVKIEEGESSLKLHEIMDAIKAAFRQHKITGGAGDICFTDIRHSNSGTVPRENASRGYGSNTPWRVWRIFINYSKYECN